MLVPDPSYLHQKVTPEILLKVAPSCPADQAEIHAEALDRALVKAGIGDDHEVAMFLAQIAHETGSFRWMRELPWKDSKGFSHPPGSQYQGRKDLGNIHPGDGEKYPGRGYIMITGLANYQYFGELTGYNIVDEPKLAEQPYAAAELATSYWSEHDIGPAARKGDVEMVTKKINGGLNGLQSRKLYYQRALRALGLDE